MRPGGAGGAAIHLTPVSTFIAVVTGEIPPPVWFRPSPEHSVRDVSGLKATVTLQAISFRPRVIGPRSAACSACWCSPCWCSPASAHVLSSAKVLIVLSAAVDAHTRRPAAESQSRAGRPVGRSVRLSVRRRLAVRRAAGRRAARTPQCTPSALI